MTTPVKIRRRIRREGIAEAIAVTIALCALAMSLVYLIGRM